MKLDGPLRVGAAGGHSAVRYRCTAMVPRRLIEFTFDDIGGRRLDGHHAFELLDRRGGTLLRHTIDAQVADRKGTWWFRVFVQPTHDVVVEELFQTIESRLAQSECAPPRWSPWVRLLRRRRGLPTRPQRG
ncbi:SRPBCC family protein [Mycobacterium sp. E802]|uniref:SRPBCC family protein n=1 Tax=Mycobacterium sp. E802 TaxID=1834152 RepID=UPI0012FB437A|nr:SRPBCC family protein [Mycobacterium sp. E802]